MPPSDFNASGQFVVCFGQPGQAGAPLLQRGHRHVHRLDVRQVGQPNPPASPGALPGRRARSATFGKVLLGARQQAIGTQEGRPMWISRVEGQENGEVAAARLRTRYHGRV